MKLIKSCYPNLKPLSIRKRTRNRTTYMTYYSTLPKVGSVAKFENQTRPF